MVRSKNYRCEKEGCELNAENVCWSINCVVNNFARYCDKHTESFVALNPETCRSKSLDDCGC